MLPLTTDPGSDMFTTHLQKERMLGNMTQKWENVICLSLCVFPIDSIVIFSIIYLCILHTFCALCCRWLSLTSRHVTYVVPEVLTFMTHTTWVWLASFHLVWMLVFCLFSLQLNANRFQGLSSLEDISAIISTPPLGGYQVASTLQI